MAKGRTIVLCLVYFVFGLYFITSSFNFFEMPEIIFNIDKWLTLVGGILIIIGGINYFRASKKDY